MSIKPFKTTVLDITYTGNDRYIYRIKKPGDRLNPPIEREWNIRIKRAILITLCKEIEDMAQRINIESPEKTDNISPFRALGTTLYKQTIPERYHDLREILSSIKTPLQISTNDPEPLWELMYLGEDFIATKYAVSRCLRKSVSRFTRKNGQSNPRGDKKERRCLIIANPMGDLPETVREMEKLTEWLEGRGIICDCLAGEQVKLGKLLSILSEHRYEIIHYTGHIYADSQKNESAFFELDGGKILSAGDIKRSVKGASLVFLNGCRSASNIKSMADAFLETGSSVVIGTVFKVSEFGARRLAERFYELVINGESIGEALKGARIEVMEKGFGATWASFIMYGDPRFQLEYANSLNNFLKGINLKRQDFEESCLRFIEKAIDYAHTVGLFTSIQLFLAMIEGEDRRLYDFIKNHDVDLLRLIEKLKKAHEIKKDSKSPEVKCSANVYEILFLAQSIAKGKGTEHIAEIDLLAAFIIQGGGTMGQMICDLGINLEEILETIPFIKPLYDIVKNQSALGPIAKDDCDQSSWEIIKQSIKKALYTGWRMVGTLHLFWAFTNRKEGCMFEALKKYGVPADKIKWLKQAFNRMIITKGNILTNKGILEIPCSENVEEILLMAKGFSLSKNNEKIAEADLMEGFMQQGGGKTGEILKKFGIDISILFRTATDST